MPIGEDANSSRAKLRAAAYAAASWARARRAAWTDAPLPAHPPELAAPAARDHVVASAPAEPARWVYETATPREVPIHLGEPAAHLAAARGPWVPLGIAAAALAAVVGGYMMFGGRARGPIPGAASGSPPARTVEREAAPAAPAGSPQTSPSLGAAPEVTAGYVIVDAPFPVAVSENDRQLTFDARRRISLATGTHQLRIANAARGYDERRQVAVKPGQETTIYVAPAKR